MRCLPSPHRGGNLYYLHRLLLYANLQLGWFRIFVQLGNHTEIGRAPAAVPTDIDRGDLQQGFFDATIPIDGGSALLRAVRFEMSFDEGALIGLRDGPNVRLVWDGVRSGFTSSAFDVDAF